MAMLFQMSLTGGSTVACARFDFHDRFSGTNAFCSSPAAVSRLTKRSILSGVYVSEGFLYGR